MLVLSRKVQEKVYVSVPTERGEVLIEVVLVDIDRSKVRIGVNAPRDCLIEREEIRAKRLAEG